MFIRSLDTNSDVLIYKVKYILIKNYKAIFDILFNLENLRL